eukprot:TRINITY_DN37230_c0_g1_i1.p1 TRINITY_DN37230_c0_g1~~TRINITY_DN37230_c0_g1_i1.p1  ORF type:complete len:608 (+),score=164.36 TRINITY_DN37230_c0_g1_i1:94-1824(+)
MSGNMNATVIESTSTSWISAVQKIFDIAGMDIMIFVSSIAVILLFRKYKFHAAPEHKFAGAKVHVSSPARKFVARADRGIEGSVAAAVGSAPATAAEVEGGRSGGGGGGGGGGKTGISVARLVDLTIAQRIQANRALDCYREQRDSGLHRHLDEALLVAKSPHSVMDYYTAVVQCAGRSASPEMVPEILDDMQKVGLQPPLSLYESAMRLLAVKKLFREALAVFDRMEGSNMKASPVTLSCLVGFAVESGDGNRAIRFFERLEEQDTPSMRACMMIMRVFAERKDWDSSIGLINRMRSRGAPVDALMLNAALTMGVANAGRLQDAEACLIANPPEADAISYNIVLKGLALQGEVSRALKLLTLMQQRGIEMNLITFNTAMDAAVRGGRCEDAWALFDKVQKEQKLKPDKCTCTTLVKALQRQPDRERLATILDIYEAVLPDCPRDLTQRLFDSLFAAAVRLPIQDVNLARRIFVQAQDTKIKLNGSDLWSYAVLLARTNDAPGCTLAWAHSGGCRELEGKRQAVDQQLQQGVTLDRAILKVANAASDAKAALGPDTAAASGGASTRKQWRAVAAAA